MKTHHDLLVKTLRKHSEALALPLGRMVGSSGHAVTREYLLHRMKRTRLIPFHGDSFELTYERPHPNTRKPQMFYNLVGVIPGKDRTLPPILVGAHYDSVIAAPCVDDNATSVAFTLALAEEYALRPLERDLIIAFFDAEEPPFYLGTTMGSRRFCEDYCKNIRFAAVIVTDLIGHDATDLDIPIPDTLKFIAKPLIRPLSKLMAVMGAETDGTFPGIVEAASKDADGLRVISFPYGYVGPVSDHAAFAKAGQPFLFLSCGQGRYYHHPKDDMKWINFEKLACITEFAGNLIERIDQTSTAADRSPRDPFDLEIRMLKKALGPALPVALKFLKVKMPKSREQLDALLDEKLHGIPHMTSP